MRYLPRLVIPLAVMTACGRSPSSDRSNNEPQTTPPPTPTPTPDPTPTPTPPPIPEPPWNPPPTKGPDPTPPGPPGSPPQWNWPQDIPQPPLVRQPTPVATGMTPPNGLPYDPVVVGGPPSTCEVYTITRDVDAENNLGNPLYPMKEGSHHPENSTIPYVNNPPLSGPNYEMWLQYKEYGYPVLRPHWVHNLRHGAIVLLYRTDAPAEVVEALRLALAQIPRPQDTPQGAPTSWSPADATCPSMGIMTPDTQLTHTFAVLAYGKMMTSNCVPNVADVVDFAKQNMWRGREFTCSNGAYPVRLPCYRFEDAPAWNTHGDGMVPEGTRVTYDHHPPTTGEYYDKTLKYGRYDAVVPAPYWMGILAKGGVVVLYRPDAPAALIAELEADYDDIAANDHYGSCGTSLVAMVQDPTLDTYFAYVATSSYMAMQCTAGWSMVGFVNSRRGNGWAANGVSCEDGTWVPPPGP